MSLSEEEIQKLYDEVNIEVEEGKVPELSPSSSFWKKVIGAIPVGLLIAGTLAPGLYANIAYLNVSTQEKLRRTEEGVGMHK